MAISLKMPRVFSAEKAAPAADLDMPTTQVRAGQQPGYDPLASVSIMEQLRSATSEMRTPKTLPVIGHLPVVRQFQVLGLLMVTFLVLGALMLFLDGRLASQGAAAESTATEMQMLSQRLARGTALASQGQSAAFAGLRDSRDRFKADLDALQNGGTVKGVSLDAPSDDTVVKLLSDIRSRWDRLDVSAGRVIDNQQSLTTLAKGLDNINQGNNAILELAQQAAQQVGQGGGSLREIEYSNQLAVLSQRIAKNANALASGEEIDPEVDAKLRGSIAHTALGCGIFGAVFGPVLGREFEFADLFRYIKHNRVRNTVWLTADVHYTAAHYYDPRKAKFTDFHPFMADGDIQGWTRTLDLLLAMDVDQVIITLSARGGSTVGSTVSLWADELSISYTPSVNNTTAGAMSFFGATDTQISVQVAFTGDQDNDNSSGL